ncbi:DUF460 domain-containing protein [Candidatus Woesearchaeota archaeon]|nr:DUF460 domain-containing protein [Candidatus Woesearchaeota archaeon]
MAGIDPGTTSSYALLNTKGQTVSIRSAKGLDTNTIISEITRQGTIIAIGTDKKNIPSMIQKISAKTGASTVKPDEDLRTSEKLQLTKNREHKNEHERDALAAAISAYKELQPLLQKIEKTLEETKNLHLKTKVTRMVICEKTSISTAIEKLTPKTEEIHTQEKPQEQKTPKPADETAKRAARENEELRKQNRKLLKALSKAKARYRKILAKAKKPPEAGKEKKVTESLWEIIRQKEKQTADLKNSNTQANTLLSQLNGKALIKKMENLTWEEYTQKNKALQIEKGDILLVNTPTRNSQKTIEALKEKILIIIHRDSNAKQTQELRSFTLIDAEKLNITETELFAAADKAEIEQEAGNTDALQRIVEDYKRQRTQPDRQTFINRP